jgi:hypothetical protein
MSGRRSKSKFPDEYRGEIDRSATRTGTPDGGIAHYVPVAGDEAGQLGRLVDKSAAS